MLPFLPTGPNNDFSKSLILCNMVIFVNSTSLPSSSFYFIISRLCFFQFEKSLIELKQVRTKRIKKFEWKKFKFTQIRIVKLCRLKNVTAVRAAAFLSDKSAQAMFFFGVFVVVIFIASISFFHKWTEMKGASLSANDSLDAWRKHERKRSSFGTDERFFQKSAKTRDFTNARKRRQRAETAGRDGR